MHASLQACEHLFISMWAYMEAQVWHWVLSLVACLLDIEIRSLIDPRAQVLLVWLGQIPIEIHCLCLLHLVIGGPTHSWLIIGGPRYPDWLNIGRSQPPDWLVIGRPQHPLTGFRRAMVPPDIKEGSEDLNSVHHTVGEGHLLVYHIFISGHSDTYTWNNYKETVFI